MCGGCAGAASPGQVPPASTPLSRSRSQPKPRPASQASTSGTSTSPRSIASASCPACQGACHSSRPGQRANIAAGSPADSITANGVRPAYRAGIAPGSTSTERAWSNPTSAPSSATKPSAPKIRAASTQLVAGAPGHQYEGDAGPVQLQQRPGRRQRRGAVVRGEEVAVRADHRAVEVGVEDLQLACPYRSMYSGTVRSGGRSEGTMSSVSRT